MFDKFGEFDSADEINETALNLRKEKDMESLKELAEENGINQDVAEAFMGGDIPYLCDDMSAAIGKIEIEAAKLDCAEIMNDWVEYIKAQCFEHSEMAKAVRKKNKKLTGCIAKLLQWSFKNQHDVSKEILKEAGVSAGRCTLGIPGIATAKRIIMKYYLEA